MNPFDGLLDAARSAPGAVGRAVEGLTSRESTGAPGPGEAAETLESVDAQLGPILSEIRSVDESAAELRAELVASREEIGALRETATALNESMTRLTGEIEHLLDRVPGLSPDRARERAEEIGSE